MKNLESWTTRPMSIKLNANHSCVMQIHFFSKWRVTPFSKGWVVIGEYQQYIVDIFFLKQLIQFPPNIAKTSFCKGISIRTTPFSRGDNSENTLSTLNIKLFLQSQPNLGMGGLYLFKWRSMPFSKGRDNWKKRKYTVHKY